MNYQIRLKRERRRNGGKNMQKRNYQRERQMKKERINQTKKLKRER